MEVIQTFSGILDQGYRGNIVYNFPLPKGLTSLSVVLTHEKEHPDNAEEYYYKRKDELAPVLEEYMEKPLSDGLLRHYIDTIKTEIQLCLMVNGVFAGNVHAPGQRKEIFISETTASHGCIPCSRISGMAKVIINVFHVSEDKTPYRLQILGEFRQTDKEMEEKSHVEKN